MSHIVPEDVASAMSHIVPEHVASAMGLGPKETMPEVIASSDVPFCWQNFGEEDVVWERP